jgi:hypothetical protein
MTAEQTSGQIIAEVKRRLAEREARQLLATQKPRW